MKPLRIALTKGRLEEETEGLLEAAGIDCTALREKGRKLVVPLEKENIEIILVKSADVITYVERGVCDIGVVGRDTLIEYNAAVFEVMDLGFGRCRFAIAGKPGTDLYGGYKVKKVATKFTKAALDYFGKKGMDVEIIKIEGSVELAPILGLSDAIFDIVESGGTLKANGLVVLEDCCEISARLVVNPASMKLRKNEIDSLIERLKPHI